MSSSLSSTSSSCPQRRSFSPASALLRTCTPWPLRCAAKCTTSRTSGASPGCCRRVVQRTDSSPFGNQNGRPNFESSGTAQEPFLPIAPALHFRQLANAAKVRVPCLLCTSVDLSLACPERTASAFLSLSCGKSEPLSFTSRSGRPRHCPLRKQIKSSRTGKFSNTGLAIITNPQTKTHTHENRMDIFCSAQLA